jgi:TonB family protein
MAAINTTTLEQYRQPVWGRMDRALRNCFTGSAILGVAVLIMVFVVPIPVPEPVSIEDVPDRIARLILKKPAPAAPSIELARPVPVVEAPKVDAPPQKAKPKPPPRKRLDKPKVAQDRGVRGRQKAKREVTENLAQVTGSLDKVLDNLSQALPASENSGAGDKKTPSKRRRRSVRSGRSSQQISSVSGVTPTAAADVSRSAIESDGISIAAITDLAVGAGPRAGGDGTASPAGGGGPGGSGTGGGGEYRSNESLLNVVRRYAPGIQFCYDNELKKNPGLRGKLVISLTVLAGGRVSDVIVVEDSLGSRSVTDCVLGQIRRWQFPAIPEGTTTFKTPFVFTPPQ